jgi:dolichyl-phosphate beta-glucosyltransferase
MSEYISQVCVECVQMLSTVPPSVFLLSLAAGAIGAVALVSHLQYPTECDPKIANEQTRYTSSSL